MEKKKDRYECKRDFEREVCEMKKRFQDARVKAVQEKTDVSIVKVPKKVLDTTNEICL